MTGWLKPYLKYKDSGIAWLGSARELGNPQNEASCIGNPSKSEARSVLTSDEMVAFLPMSCVGTDGRIDAGCEFLFRSVERFHLFPQRRHCRKDNTVFRKRKGACLDRLLPRSVSAQPSSVYSVLCSRSCLSFYTVRHCLMGFGPLAQ